MGNEKEHPSPLVPADADLRGNEWMPYFGDRLGRSEFNARSDDATWRAGHNLWWAAWNNVPAASLPNDDVALTRFADLGRDVKAFRRIKDGALHGFILCSDGRLYHPLLAEQAIIAWDHRVKDREKKRRWREGKNRSGDRDGTVPGTGTGPGRDGSRDRDGTVPETGTGPGRDGSGDRDGTVPETGTGPGRDGSGDRDGTVPETVQERLTGQDRTGQDRTDSKKEGLGEESQNPTNESSKTAPAPFSAYAFEGNLIRLTHKDFHLWKKTYHAVPDLMAELQTLDTYYDRELSGDDRKRWYIRCSAALDKKHQSAIATSKKTNGGILPNEGVF